MHSIATVFLAILALLPTLLPAQSPGAGAPNIVLILADDLGKYDLSIYGGKMVETPHIDQLARSGALYRQGYAMAAVCSPSRMALLSGQYPQRYGYDFQPHQRYPRNVFQRWIAQQLMARDGWIPEKHATRAPGKQAARLHGISGEAYTLAERLRHRGYRTGLFGKWHLGYSEMHHPQQHGFDTFYGFLEAFSLYAKPNNPDIVNAPASLFADKVQWKKRRGATAILRGTTPVTETRYLTNAIADEGIAFMRDAPDQPFFAMFSFSAPHAPWQAPKPLYDSLEVISNHHLRVYAAMVRSLDAAVGRILAHLREQRLLENTIVVFTSDNGIAAYNGHLDPAPHRGSKFTFFEGGINVPLLISWPGTIPPGQSVEPIAGHLDVTATLIAAAGAASDRLDGENLLPALLSKMPHIPQRPLYWRAGYNWAIRSDHYKAIIDDSSRRIFLFDLSADPGEHNDLAAHRADIIEHLRADLQQWAAAMRPPAWPHVVNYKVEMHGAILFFGI